MLATQSLAVPPLLVVNRLDSQVVRVRNRSSLQIGVACQVVWGARFKPGNRKGKSPAPRTNMRRFFEVHGVLRQEQKRGSYSK